MISSPRRDTYADPSFSFSSSYDLFLSYDFIGAPQIVEPSASGEEHTQLDAEAVNLHDTYNADTAMDAIATNDGDGAANDADARYHDSSWTRVDYRSIWSGGAFIRSSQRISRRPPYLNDYEVLFYGNWSGNWFIGLTTDDATHMVESLTLCGKQQ